MMYTDDDVQRGISNILMHMHRDRWKPDYVVGLVGGGCIPAVYISHYLGVTLYTLSAQLNSADGMGLETNAWMAEDAYLCKNILLVTDVNRTGATLNWVIDDWKSSAHPASTVWHGVWNNNVRFAALVDNVAANNSPRIDYCGLEIAIEDDSQRVVFPWERL